MPDKKIDNAHKKFKSAADSFGNLFISFFHYAALFAIGALITWGALLEFKELLTLDFSAIHPESGQKINSMIDRILLLFIYLELGAMVGIYFKTQHMPVRYLIYIAITALTRLLISDVSHHEPGLNSGWKILLESGAILMLCFAVLIVKMATLRFPSQKDDVEEDI